MQTEYLFGRPLLRRPSRTELTAALVIVVFVGCLFIANRILWGRQGEAYHQQLIRDFRSIQPFPGAVVLGRADRFNPWWPHKAVVGADYTSTATYADIRAYYDQQLISRGWRIAGEEPYSVWGKDLGGRLRNYCKGPLGAEIEYAGSQSGRTYSFTMSWALSHKCASGR